MQVNSTCEECGLLMPYCTCEELEEYLDDDDEDEGPDVE